jgi:hypothetical protein
VTAQCANAAIDDPHATGAGMALHPERIGIGDDCFGNRKGAMIEKHLNELIKNWFSRNFLQSTT